MAYQNVSTPRFYIDILSYLKAHGLLSAGEYDTIFFDVSTGWYLDSLKLIGINPTSPIELESQNTPGNQDFLFFTSAINFKSIMPEKQNFMMALGHNLKSANAQIYSQAGEAVNGGDWNGVANEGYVNLDATDGRYPAFDGFSISLGNDAHDLDTQLLRFRFDNQDNNGSPYPINIKIGSLLYGTYYEMPNAPNLSLTMSREYGGTKEITTHNGSSISNTMWSKPPAWGDLGAWELGGLNPAWSIPDPPPALSKSGRRTWDLKFSYMDDGDLWGSNQSISNFVIDGYYEPIYTGAGGTNNTYPHQGYDEEDLFLSGDPGDPLEDISRGFNYNILTDDNFFSQVWHKTLGGTLPFIFQPDKDNINPDQFAICRFKKDTLKATQSAFNVYDISVSIEEVW